MTTGPHCCTIIPPYLLEALTRSPEPHVARSAREALRHAADLRRSRRQAPWARGATRGGLAPPFSGPGTQLRRAPDGAPADTPSPRARKRPTEPGPRRTISDAGGTITTPGDEVRNEGQPASGDPAVDEAYEGLGATWQLYWAAYGRDSLDGKGMPLLATVHYGTNYDNAFWDGHQMVFGDGDGIVFLRFTRSLDVIGHELTHGVTEHTAGLLYDGQSGALNESLSDVFGMMVKQHALGQSAADADWLVGAELLAPGVKGRALRDMRDPGTAYDDPRLGKDPQPAHMDDYVDTSEDNGGVHINSGIPNRAFALAALAIGGNAWEGAGPIWYAVLDGPGIKADCDFATFADLTVAAAADLHGDGSAEHSAVRKAWAEVGVSSDSDADAGAGATGAAAGTGTMSDESDALSSDTPGGPAHGEVPPVDTQVLLRRTGGFAGLVRERRLALAELPEPDTYDWQRLLAAPTLERIARTSEREVNRPDAFCYSVVCDRVDVDVTLAEPHLPDAIHQLFERTLGG
ncbi:MAG: M4 family metallopeptidase [Micrococcales bacterium]|nr:M4 family metallopeptidase [Micrococcales bacterium]